MKKTFTALCILAVMCVNAQTPGLVGHWQFSGNANDASGNKLHGTATNITYVAGKDGVPNSAAYFDGSSSYIQVPYDSMMNLTNYTITARVKITSFFNGHCQANMILNRGGGAVNGSYSLQFNDNGYDNDCNVRDPTKNIFCGHAGPGSPPLSLPFKVTPTLVAETWYCVAGVYNGDSMNYYIDGDFKYGVPITLPIGNSTAGITFGADLLTYAPTPTYWFNGIIDDLKLYNVALKQSSLASYCDRRVDTTTSIADVQKGELNLYPNPNSGEFTLTATHINDVAKIEVFNTTGQLAYMKEVLPVAAVLKERIVLPQAASGLYLLRVSANGTTRNIRFVVNR